MEDTNEILVLKQLVSQLLTRIELLEAENAELRRRLSLTSHNSDKPPSTDGLSKKTAALPKESNKKQGGQTGHEGKTLKMVEVADKTILHHPIACPCCRRTFAACEIEAVVQRRQVFDMPAPRLEVTEHQVGAITCCGQVHVGVFPDGVNAPVQYGDRIKAMSVLLNTDYRLPFEKISQLFSDLYDCSFNESTAVSANQQAYQALEPIEALIKACILQEAVVHFDETGMRVEGSLHWMHVACSSLFTYLFVHKKRGKQALQGSDSLLKDFTHYAIHDCWVSYFAFTDCQHGLCNAHIIRELVNLVENGSAWANQMYAFLFDLYKQSQKATVVLEAQTQWEERYQAICRQADLEEPPAVQKTRGKPKNTKGRNLLNRLVKHQSAVLAFAFVQHVPFTNNLAERDIRCVKVKQKVAMCFRRLNGAQTYARIQGFVSTTRKHGLNTFQQLCEVFQNNSITWKTS